MATFLAALSALAKIIPFLDRLAAIFQGRQQRAAGRAEAVAEQQKDDLDAVKKVTDARRAARDSDGGLHEDDKYLRD